MATPIALPVWTLLLAGGHIAPLVLLPIALIIGADYAAGLLVAAVVCLVAARIALARRYRQAALSVVLHPMAVAVTLILQWRALLRTRRGRATTWRGRTYPE
jgi:hypothetical protein